MMTATLGGDAPPALEESRMPALCSRSLAGIAAAALLLLSAGALAAPITMTPGSASIDGFGGDFSLALTSGDTTDNILHFSVSGSGGMSLGAAALVFDGVDLLAVGETSDPHGLLTGLSIPSYGTVGGLLVDFGSASTASFYVQTSGVVTTATLYSLSTNGGSLSRASCGDILDRQMLSFASAEQPVPEPSAAVVFSVGLLVLSRFSRRR